MANVRTYQIVINGVKESINAIETLNAQLDALAEKIDALAAKTVNVQTASTSTAPTTPTRNTSHLEDEDKLLKQIRQTEEKVAEARREDYKTLLAQKDLLKEAVKDQKELAAQERLTANAYNLQTMEGMKEKLADIKKVMQTTDISDNDAFKKLTQEANELNSKLLEIEKSYGQFGRQVGNYPAAAEGFKQLEVNVGGVTQQFDNARQAMKALKQEMQTLSVKKDMGLISEEEAKRLEDLIPTVKQLESSIQDAGKPMDSIMDTMESITALVSAGKGISAFFGFDDDKIQKSIQQLVALQNAMKSLQTIQKQLQSGEGFGKYFNMGGEAIDGFVNKLFGVKKASDEAATAENVQAAATKGVATSSNAATTATNNQTVATKSLTTAQKAATVAAKALSTALKGIGIGVVIYGITQLVDGIGSWIKSLNELSAAEKAAEKASEASQAAYADAQAELNIYKAKIDTFNGSKKEEKELIDELNKKYGEQMGTYQSLVEWKEALINKSKEYIKQLTEEAEFSVYQEEYTKALKTQVQIQREVDKLKNEGKEYTLQYKLATDALNDATSTTNKLLDELEKKLQSLNHTQSVFGRNIRNWVHDLADELRNLGENLSGKTSGGTSGVDSRIKAEEVIQQLTLKLMRDGLRKRLILLDDERRKTLDKVKGTAEQKLEIEKKYNDLSLAEIKKYVESVQKEYKQLGKSIRDEAINLELSDKDNLMQEMNNKLDVNRFSFGGTKEYLKYLIQNTDTFKDYWMNVAGELYKIQEDFYKDSVEEQLKFFNQIEKLQKEDALLRKQQAEQAAIDEVDIWAEEQKQRVEDLEASIATIEGLGNKATEDQKKQLIKSRKELQYINENYDTLANEKWINYLEKYRQIQQQYNNEYKEIELNGKKERSKIYTDFYETEIQKFNNFSTQLSRDVQRQPELTQIGFINIAKTKKNYEQARQQIKAVIDNIRKDIMDINLKYQSDENKNFGLISPEDYAATMNKLSDLENEFLDKQNDIDEKIKDLPKDVLSQINDIIQQVGQAATQIMSSFSEITSNQYEEMIDQQQKYVDQYSDLLDKQKDKTQEYADAIKDIEGELSSARGDRRQELIDQLNAEMAAQRASLEQEKRIEKEKEKAERRKSELEYDQAVARKKMDEAQALINGVMAVSMAAVNKWPVPAIPMIALATAVGAAQYAAVRSQYIPKPSYGDGGVIVGKSHREGGVQILGGQAEVEGGEFITNKVTTSKNVELLEYINTKKRKVDISDLIDFYSSGKPSKNITAIKTRFADGGQIPQLRSDITFNDRLIDAFEEYSTRPQYVQVIDIINETERLNQVKVISGLET